MLVCDCKINISNAFHSVRQNEAACEAMLESNCFSQEALDKKYAISAILEDVNL